MSCKSLDTRIAETIPAACRNLVDKLIDSGYDTFVVGGCIRDTVLQTVPHDWDIATQATPTQVKDVLNDTPIIDTGIKHGTVTAVANGTCYEITTFRAETEYSDHRHPDDISFVNTIEEDLARRDFTMNAIAWSPTKGIIDPFNGIHDIHGKTIRCVGDPHQRFTEDPLRILRALRFAARLGFAIDDKTTNTATQLSNQLRHISRERIASELLSLFESDAESIAHVIDAHHAIIMDAIDSDELRQVYGYDQNNRYHTKNLWDHSLDVLRSIKSNNAELKLAAWLHDIGKPASATNTPDDPDTHYPRHPEASADIAHDILESLRMSNKAIEHVTFLVRWHDLRPKPTRRSARRFIARCDAETPLIEELLELIQADIAAHNPIYAEKQLDEHRKATSLIHALLEEESCFTVRDLAINGNDLKDLGFPQGKPLGECLSHLCECVLDEQLPNNRIELLAEAKAYLILRVLD